MQKQYASQVYSDRLVSLINNRFTEADGSLKLLSAKEANSYIEEFGRINFIVWCYEQAIYTLPTVELVDWLKTQINDPKDTLEICSGNNGLSDLLGITGVDSRAQNIYRKEYKRISQATTDPPDNIVNMDAIEAVIKFKPNLVIASWATQEWDGTHGFERGVKETIILNSTDKYIHIGNEGIHGEKKIRRVPHQALRFDWLVTRSQHPQKNCIYIWKGGKIA